jgi:glycosyltransferase involved in cell wall biosynthesis
MRILLVGNYVPDGQQSMRRYAEWIKEICLSNGHTVTLIKPKPILSRLDERPYWKRWAGYIDKFVFFRHELRAQARRHDLVHILDHSNAMYVRQLKGHNCIVTCHDLLAVKSARGDYPGQRTRWSGRIFQNWIADGLRRSRYVICVSQKTSEDFLALFGDTGAQIRVIHHALNRRVEPAGEMPPEMVRKFGIPADRPYLLHVGGGQWYKNPVGVVGIFSHLVEHAAWSDAALVIAGRPLSPEMRNFVQNSKLGNRVIEACNVPDDELNLLYSNAKALLFPSLQEGFGWPILEAQACGCPVITSNRPPMTEVAGAGAIRVDPEDFKSAAEEINAHTHDLEAMVALGFKNLRRFQQDEAARKYNDFYGQVMNAAGRSRERRAEEAALE